MDLAGSTHRYVTWLGQANIASRQRQLVQGSSDASREQGQYCALGDALIMQPGGIVMMWAATNWCDV
jgi:hypothetical protein